MDDTLTPKQIDTIERHVAITRKHLEQAIAALDVLTKAYGPTVNSQVTRLFETWSTLWRGRYRDRYVFSGAKDGGQFKRLLKILDVDDIEQRLRRYINTDENFLVQNRHALNLFFPRLNAYCGFAASPEFAVIGCTHTPRCGTEVEHTRILLREVKGV